ncbi:hypothetical protein DU87_06065 [Methanosarcina mazei]|uniref:Glycosyltransferase family 4 protein n=2 Tax=Methanosarcina mazei TaxID=2209 RepID=A0A0F8S4J0_METMZ|nr:hypothetical protein DU87_06065 [Methanosarcina mazei]
MRILAVQDADWIKKGPHQQHHLLEGLSSRGHEICVIGYDQLWKNEKKSLVSKRKLVTGLHKIYEDARITYILPSFLKFPFLDYGSYLLTSRIEIKNYVEIYNPDAVIGFTSVLSNYWGMKFANKNNIPFVYYWTDVIHTLIPFKPFRIIAKVIEKDIIKKSSKVLAINEVLKDYLISFGAKTGNTQVISGGVNFDRFDVSKINPDDIRKKYNISNDDFVLFFMGWLYEFSGLVEVITELNKVRDLHPDLKLMIVGEGDQFKSLIEIVDRFGLQDRVILTGKRPYEEIPQLISVANICLLPAYNNEVMKDIVPIKLYEYLAMHKPVITTKLPGVMKEFGENNGVIYVNRPEDVIKTVINLNDDEIIRNSLMAEKFIQRYNWNIIISEFENLISQIQR